MSLPWWADCLLMVARNCWAVSAHLIGGEIMLGLTPLQRDQEGHAHTTEVNQRIVTGSWSNGNEIQISFTVPLMMVSVLAAWTRHQGMAFGYRSKPSSA